MTTSTPASASSAAIVAPPAPDPTTTTEHSTARSAVTSLCCVRPAGMLALMIRHPVIRHPVGPATPADAAMAAGLAKPLDQAQPDRTRAQPPQRRGSLSRTRQAAATTPRLIMHLAGIR